MGSTSVPAEPSGVPALESLLESAARLQELVPDAVLVGGTAAALHAGHRLSIDHDHVLVDLRDRFDLILDALEREGEWVTNRVQAGKIILGELGGIETRLRQLIRTRPLETEERRLPSRRVLTVPTFEETLRVKAFLIVKRNQLRDYLDVAAMASVVGAAKAADILVGIDDYYADLRHDESPVATQVASQLADPRPKDAAIIPELPRYKGLERRWRRWDDVTDVCGQVARAMVG
ncbi:nucleotidyl transferase AbiEii/AbiGii toxin family protein [Isoptericola sp. BMS4]|uniref:nucleotidyl transferase AbiEii/AbiGii toxin family protein n=1 Tax=Isoptericola sp. BMS4 TaxID=2527875 RepID=UPI001420975B|nr:nucleotidyl transferase AbiEii/AbiGii toxin family protein [Isoptericola sp. BMS4]